MLLNKFLIPKPSKKIVFSNKSTGKGTLQKPCPHELHLNIQKLNNAEMKIFICLGKNRIKYLIRDDKL